MSRRAFAFILLTLGGLSALGFGIYGLVSPAATAAAVSLEPQNAFGRGEIRALYGGMWTAMGVLVFGALRRLASRGAPRPAVDTRAIERIRTIALCWTGVPLARGLGIALDGSEGGPAALFILAEVAMVATLLGGLALLPRRRG
jgi:hypothetical protein